jgi:hypothetical protein
LKKRVPDIVYRPLSPVRRGREGGSDLSYEVADEVSYPVVLAAGYFFVFARKKEWFK